MKTRGPAQPTSPKITAMADLQSLGEKCMMNREKLESIPIVAHSSDRQKVNGGSLF
jgi:hypothetical protein